MKIQKTYLKSLIDKIYSSPFVSPFLGIIQCWIYFGIGVGTSPIYYAIVN
jgi:hypothetical protein